MSECGIEAAVEIHFGMCLCLPSCMLHMVIPYCHLAVCSVNSLLSLHHFQAVPPPLSLLLCLSSSVSPPVGDS